MPSAPFHSIPKPEGKTAETSAEVGEDAHRVLKIKPRDTEAALVEPHKPKSRRRRPFVVLGAVALLLLGSIGGYLWQTRNQESTDDAQIEADIVPIGSRLFGQIEHVYVADNQAVKAGQVIVSLDTNDLQAKRDQAEAELDTAKAQAEAAEAQVRLTEASARGGLLTAKAAVMGSSEQAQSSTAQIAAAEASVRRAEADAERSRLDLGRTQQLMASNAVTAQQLEHDAAVDSVARATLEEAKARLEAARQSRGVALSQVAQARGHLDQTGPIDSQIGVAMANNMLAKARVRSVTAQLRLAELQLSYAKIAAPADGRISKLSVHEGQLVQTGQGVAEFIPLSTYVVANFKETQIGRVRPGQRAEVKLDAYSGRTFSGTVESESSGTGSRFALLPPDNASGNFVKVVQRVPVRIRWSSAPNVPLQAGLSADVTVYVK